MEKYQIHKAALESDYDLASTLIKLKVNLNELDLHGHSPLHWAVFRGDIDFVKLLLEAGADPNILSSDGVTPKWRARDFGLVEIDKILDNFGGKIITNKEFDRNAFMAFSQLIGQPIPKEDNSGRQDYPGLPAEVIPNGEART